MIAPRPHSSDSAWANAYVGLPWADKGRARSGCDCWGLARIVYADLAGIDLPSYDEAYASAAELAEIEAIVTEEVAGATWSRIADPRPLDLVLFRRGRARSHVGLVVEAPLMLHMDGDDCAKIGNWRGGAFERRLIGFYRHRDMAGATR
jgi:cell wall-associated NlpC family hydrolase